MIEKKRVLIIEDEPLARQRLKKLLSPYSDLLDIIGEAINGEEGLEMIERLKPEFIFLDIQMPVMNGFEMLTQLQHVPYIIFTTAYDEYAIKAFEENSIDYLMKPIRPERLKLTLDKMARLGESKNETSLNHENLNTLIQNLSQPKKLSSITVHLGDKIMIVNLSDIIYFHAEDKMTIFYTTTGKKHLITHSLSQLETKLPEYFMRLNRSCIINEDQIFEIRKGFNGKLVFEMKNTDKTRLNSGSAYIQSIKERLRF